MPNHRTPRNLKVLKGTDRADRRPKNIDPRAAGLPDMPEGHGEDFAAAWAKHIALLEPLRVLTPADALGQSLEDQY